MKKFLFAGGGVLAFIFVLALVLSRSMDPVTKVILPLTKIRADENIGALVRKELPAHFRSAVVRAFAFTSDKNQFLKTVAEYLKSAEAGGMPVAVVSGISDLTAQDFPSDFPGQVTLLYPEQLPKLPSVISDLLMSRMHILILLEAKDASHRMGQNLMMNLQRTIDFQIPTIVVSKLFLKADQESQLVPKCDISASTIGGDVIDLGCLLLKISRQQQLAKPALDQQYVHIEQIDPMEEVLSIYSP